MGETQSCDPPGQLWSSQRVVSIPVIRQDPVSGQGAMKVAGNSMDPTIPDGSFVLCDFDAEPEPGDIVVARLLPYPGLLDGLVVKRLVYAYPENPFDDRLCLKSDNPNAPWPWQPFRAIGVVTHIVEAIFLP